jgi:hypothetical protein
MNGLRCTASLINLASSANLVSLFPVNFRMSGSRALHPIPCKGGSSNRFYCPTHGSPDRISCLQANRYHVSAPRGSTALARLTNRATAGSQPQFVKRIDRYPSITYDCKDLQVARRHNGHLCISPTRSDSNIGLTKTLGHTGRSMPTPAALVNSLACASNVQNRS